MPTWTDPTGHIWGVGEVLTAANLNTYIQQNLAFLANPPSVMVFQVAATTVTTGVGTALPWAFEQFKTDAGMHSTSSNNSRLICTVSAKYNVWGNVEFASNNTGWRSMYFVVNGNVIVGFTNQPAVQSGDTALNLSVIWPFSAGDYVELFVAQNSGGNLNLINVPSYSPHFGLTFKHF